MNKILKFFKPKEMDFINDPINKLIKNISIPASLGMLFNSMFNFTDTYFAGNLIGKEGLGALTASFPLFFIFLALGSGIGTGVNVLVSNALGASNIKKAKQIAGNAIVFTHIFSIVLSIVAFFSMPYLVRLVSTIDFYNGTLQYMNVLVLGMVFFVVTGVYNSLLQTQGDTISFTKILLITVVINAILDPLFLGIFGILPNFGVSGLAIATVISNVITYLYIFNKLKKTEFMKQLVKEDYKLKYENIKAILIQGIPASLNMATMVLGMFVIMNGIKKIGTSNTMAGYGPAIRIEQLVLLPTIGFNVAAMTLVARNYGAKNYERISKIYNKLLFYGFIITFIGTIVSLIFGKYLFRIFTSDVEVMKHGLNYLYIDAWVFYAYVIVAISISTLQGLKKPNYGIFIGLYRQFVVPIIFIFIFCNIMKINENGIWYSIFISTWSAAMITLFYTKFTIKKLKYKIPLENSKK